MPGLNSNTKLLMHCDTHDLKPSDGNSMLPKGTMHLVSSVYKFNSASFLFDGDSDYYKLPENGYHWMSVASGRDVTLELWVKHLDHVGAEYYLHHYLQSTYYWDLRHTHGSGIELRAVYNGSTVFSITATAASEITDTSWHHVAVCKVGTEYGIYLDGTQVSYGSYSSGFSFANAYLWVGCAADVSSFFYGYMDDIRITDSNVYSANPVAGITDTITIPVSALSASADDRLLLSGSIGKYDASDSINPGGAHDPVWYGDATIYGTSAAIKKFGTASLYFDGTGDCVSFADSADWDICGDNTDSWTIDAWIRVVDKTRGYNPIVCHSEDGGNNIWYFIHYGASSNDGLSFVMVSGGVSKVSCLQGAITISDNTWHHVAMCKVADEYGTYIDGVQVAYDQDSTEDTFSAALTIGSLKTNENYGNLYIDELRIQHSNYFNAAPNATPDDTITVLSNAYNSIIAGNQAIIIG